MRRFERCIHSFLFHPLDMPPPLFRHMDDCPRSLFNKARDAAVVGVEMGQKDVIDTFNRKIKGCEGFFKLWQDPVNIETRIEENASLFMKVKKNIDMAQAKRHGQIDHIKVPGNLPDVPVIF